MTKNSAFLLAILLCGCLSANAMTTEMQKNYEFVQMQTEYVIDEVFDFLKGLESDVETQISSLDSAVATQTAYLNGVILSLGIEISSKSSECASDLSEIENLAIQKVKLVQYVEWITQKIQEDKDKIDYYNTFSCQKTLEFVEYLRHTQTALNLIDFLRQAITDYSFVQLNSLQVIVGNLIQYPEYFSTSKGLELMLTQLNTYSKVDPSDYAAGESLESAVSDRTGEEIGSGHVDNEQGELDLDDFDSSSRQGLSEIKERLFEILDQLEASIRSGLEEKINDMILLAETISDYIITLEQELHQLEKDLEEQQALLDGIDGQIVIATAEYDQCVIDYQALVDQLASIQTQLDSYLITQAEIRAQLVNQLTELQGIIEIYEENVYNITGVDMKARVDDLEDNSTVDYTGSVDDRELKEVYGAKQTEAELDELAKENAVVTEVDGSDQEGLLEASEVSDYIASQKEAGQPAP